jgi:WhiB family transcriptional regulator, redox-sensing transcriptional regulator
VPTHPIMNPDGLTPSCAGTSLDSWFPDEGDRHGWHMDLVKRVCDGCPVKDLCLDWALHHEDHGIWAGTGPTERRVMRRERGISLRTLTIEEIYGASLWRREPVSSDE